MSICEDKLSLKTALSRAVKIHPTKDVVSLVACTNIF